MVGFSTKQQIMEYAGKITGTEFVVLDLLKRGGSEGHPKRFQVDEICEWTGADTNLKTPIFEALNSLKQNGFVEDEFLMGKGPEGSGTRATRFTWINNKGRDLLRCIDDDKRLRSRALLRALEVYTSNQLTYEQLSILEKLYLDANTMKLAFLMNKRA
ncbi:MAG: hypothetical protein KGH61_05655 [Candidatus Micrarchaeota archaeon]|nr:hypothetical protein [Candidatus Micrarchaeota archaeon]MDE1848399.1 hypothetical protein [Candidatus Micrarchaeota archaeon]